MTMVAATAESVGACAAPLDEATSLASRVGAHIRQVIVSNGLRPGDILPGEAETSRHLKVSRPVVREAWNGLAALGVLEVAPGRKPRVARLVGLPMRSVIEQAVATGQATPVQVLELRRGIEVQMVALAAQRRDPDALAAMQTAVFAMAGCLHDYRRYAEFDLTFHLQIAKGAGNPFHLLLVQACADAFQASMRAGLESRVSEAELLRLQRNHEEIFEAVRDRDPARAAASMSVHFDEPTRALIRTARPSGEDPTAPQRHRPPDGP